jgi:hypothetical protein
MPAAASISSSICIDSLRLGMAFLRWERHQDYGSAKQGLSPRFRPIAVHHETAQAAMPNPPQGGAPPHQSGACGRRASFSLAVEVAARKARTVMAQALLTRPRRRGKNG